MTALSTAHSVSDPNRPWLVAALAAIGVLTLARLLALAVSAPDLYADESQYWVWSRTLDWGYFSKPPLVAWTIAASTFLLGDSDFAIRAPAPVLHALAAVFICLAGDRLAGARIGFWAALVYITMPGVWLGAGVMSTDALLLPAWAGGLYALTRLRDGAGWASAAGLGAAIGLGLLAKYAMVYFIAGTVLALLADSPSRRALFSWKGLLAAGVAAALIAPNIAWNAAHDFATVQHTAANANWGGTLFQPAAMADFLASQLGVFGPALFLVLAVAMWPAARRALDRQGGAETLLVLYVLPALLVISGQALISRAHANWAAGAYVGASLLVVFFLFRGGAWRRWVLYGSVILHVLMGAGFAMMAASPAIAEASGLANAFKRVRGWEATAEALATAAQTGPYAGVVFDDRNVFHQMQRYGGAIEPPLYMWRRYAGPHNHADLAWPLPDGFAETVLVVSERPLDTPKIAADFAVFEPVSEVSIPLGGGRSRDFTLWRAQGYARVVRDEQYEREWALRDAQRDD